MKTCTTLVAKGDTRQSSPELTIGCPAACGNKFADVEHDDILIQDTRGRWWHLECVAAALARITRKNEDELRGDKYKYEWNW